MVGYESPPGVPEGQNCTLREMQNDGANGVLGLRGQFSCRMFYTQLGQMHFTQGTEPSPQSSHRADKVLGSNGA